MAVWRIDKQRSGVNRVTYSNRLTNVHIPKVELTEDLEPVELKCRDLAFMWVVKNNEWMPGDIIAMQPGRVFAFSVQEDAAA